MFLLKEKKGARKHTHKLGTEKWKQGDGDGMKAPIINQSEAGRERDRLGERGCKAEKGERYTSLLGWFGHSSQNRRCVQDSTVPSAQAADHFWPVLRVSLLISSPRGGHLPQPGVIVSSIFFFLLGGEKTWVFNKLEPRKESPPERGGSYEGQNRVEGFVLDLENLGVRLQ